MKYFIITVYRFPAAFNFISRNLGFPLGQCIKLHTANDNADCLHICKYISWQKEFLSCGLRISPYFNKTVCRQIAHKMEERSKQQVNHLFLLRATCPPYIPSFTKFCLQDWWSSAGLVVQVRTGGAVTGLVVQSQDWWRSL